MASRGDAADKSSTDLLDVSGARRSAVESLFLLKNPPPPEQRGTFRVPASSVLDRVRNFLPQLRQAEEELRQRVADHGADSVSIEADDSERPHIEMSLGLCPLDSDTSDDSDSDSEAESCGEEVRLGPVTADNIRLPGAARRPLVTELGSAADSE